ncbi:hypothetical protein PMG11_11132 [Penicillium brasilianum]|uniref:Uncharacterized protein n=1 Tax=Penicillium brasilianum TaxID=104259 RepID=A0A0F7U5C0_PENBI|nr:hypothetical protein PMG11_11132 [Penicillium brasilianum]
MFAERISLPEFDPDELEKLIYTLLSVDGEKWLPKERARDFLCVRPTIIGTDSQIGVAKPTAALLYIIVGYMARWDTPAGGKRLLTNPHDVVRSWVGGFGYAKRAQITDHLCKSPRRHIVKAITRFYGYMEPMATAPRPQLLCGLEAQGWQEGTRQAPLDNQLILNGVTRRSCLDLAKERLGGDLEVTERMFTIGEIQEAASEGRLLEAFAAGTAWFITPISLIHHRGKDIKIPTGPNGTLAEITSDAILVR